MLLTLPLTIITLGLFYFVVNGLAFNLAAALVPGFTVADLWSAHPRRDRRQHRVVLADQAGLQPRRSPNVDAGLGRLPNIGPAGLKAVPPGGRGSARRHSKIRALESGHQRSWTLPMMYFFGTSPHWRLSELLFRWSPMTK